MRVEFINPFVNAAFTIFEAALQAKAVKGDLAIKPSPKTDYDVAVVVGVTGDIKGAVIYAMTSDTAKGIASAMMMGMPIGEIDELAKSAIGELGNMITANASIGLSASGYNCDITPPSIFIGKNMQLFSVNIQTLVVPMETSLGVVEMNIALAGK